MRRSKGETHHGAPILFDECSDTIKYYLLGNDSDSSQVTLKAYGINERGVEYGGTMIHVPADVLVRMADQLRTSASTDGVNPEILLSATNDQVAKFLHDRIDAMYRLLSDSAMLPAMIASLVTVLPANMEDTEGAKLDAKSDAELDDLYDELEGVDDEDNDAEEVRELVERGGYGVGLEPEGDEEANDESIEDCDIEVDTGCEAFTMLRYCVRVAYEMIRTNQIRENKRNNRSNRN